MTDQYGNKTFQTISLTAQVTQPSVKTLKPTITDEEFISLAGEIKSTGGQQILNKGFMISSTPDFKNALEMQVSEESNSSETQFSADIILPTEIIYYKAFAHTKLGESYGETVRYNPFSAKDFGFSTQPHSKQTGWIQNGLVPLFLTQRIGFSMKVWDGYSSANLILQTCGFGLISKNGSGQLMKYFPSSFLTIPESGYTYCPRKLKVKPFIITTLKTWNNQLTEHYFK